MSIQDKCEQFSLSQDGQVFLWSRQRISYWLLSLFCISVLVGCPSANHKRSDTEQRVLSERFVELGVHYMNFGQFNVALEKLEHALDIDDDNANAHNSIAVFYERIQENLLAENHFKVALNLAPKDVSVLNNYGRFLCNNGDNQQGMIYLNRSADTLLNERPWFALTNLGQCQFKQGDIVAAERSFRLALQKKPSYAPALLNMAEISYEQSVFIKTRAFIERFLNYSKATAKALLLGFLAEQELEQEHKAAEYKSELLLRFPLSEEAVTIKLKQDLKLKTKSISSRLIPSESR